MLLALVIAIPAIGVWEALTLTSVNPGSQFDKARDTQRRSDLLQITNSVYQYAAKNNGELPPDFPLTETCIGKSASCYDLERWVVPDLIALMPEDPSTGNSGNTGYTIFRNSAGRVVARAKGEGKPTIEVQR